MLEDRIAIYTVVLVAVLLLATVSYNNMKARDERQRAGVLPKLPGDEEQDATQWLSKFAVQGGSVVGETVALAGGQLILKQAGQYKSIDLGKARIEGDEVVVSASVDWDAAMTAGAAWHTANTKGQDDAITSQLTRSEDVRAPALGAMKEREDTAAPSDDSEE